MEYGRVLKRAWEITWRWKVLWILGFLASLGSGAGGGGGQGAQYQVDSSDLNRWFGRTGWPEVWAAIGGAVLALLCLGILIGIGLWVLSVIARGGLIAGVQQVEDEGSTTLGAAWRVGVRRFWTLFGLSVLSSLPVLMLALAMVLALAAGLGVAVAGSGQGFQFSEPLGALGVGGAVICGLSFCCLLIPLTIVLDQIRVYGERAAVLEGLGWIDAFKRGWQVLRDHLGPTVVLWLIFLAIGLVFGVVLAGLLAAVLLPFLPLLRNAEPAMWMLVPGCFGGLLAILILALVRSIIETFTSGTWTLAYRELTGLGRTEAVVELPVEPAAEA
jgi:hypothetical protein